jgi:ribosomal protein L16 Arg81 hydroxylase
MEQQMKVHRLHDPNFEFYPKDTKDAVDIELTPGSILYFPAGYWYYSLTS